jgi:hypothetical protein
MAALGYRYAEQLFSGSVGGDDEVFAEGVVDRAEKAQRRLPRAETIAVPAAGGCDMPPARPIRFRGEVDRVCFDTTAEVQLLDGAAGPLWVQRRGSRSVVVWSP